MVGIVVCAHGNLALEFVNAANFITGQAGVLNAVAVDHNVAPPEARNMVKEAIRAADDGNGVLVFTDMYGGTPSNICISLQDDLRMEIVAGVNLPQLVKAVSLQNTHDVETMAKKLRDYGKENIYLASDFLRARDA